jgi:transcriptional regulator with XRE-family HTH domain
VIGDDLARELRLLKDKAGLSLSSLAARCWCSRSALDRYLNGKVFPPRDTVRAISDACGGDTAALLALWERAWVARDDNRRATLP